MEVLQTGWSRARAVNSANPDLVYMVAAVMLTVIAVITISDPEPDSGYKNPDGLFTALVVVGSAVVAFLRKWPIAVLTALTGALLAQISLGYELGDIAFVNSLVIVFFAASRSSARTDGLVAAMPVIVLLTLFYSEELGFSDLLINILIFGVAFAGGVLVRTRVSRIHQVETYAAELSVQRDEAAREAAKEERARIARELHDAVGHTLNLIVVQAGAAQRVRDVNPSAAYEALKTIENTGRQALGDMDRMLGILRDGEDGSDASALGPRPSLARLNSMLEEARAAGLDVSLKSAGEPRKLPVSVDLTAYRIIQESITNVIKHAPSAAAEVVLEYSVKTLKIDIRNGPPGRGMASKGTGGGRGLPGMKERVALFGGTIETAALNDGGFLVRVSLPLGGVS